MKRLHHSEPMAVAWEVLQGRAPFAEIQQWPDVLRDTAITLALDESKGARVRSRAVATLSNLDDALASETCEFVLETQSSSLMRQAAISANRAPQILLRRVKYDPSYVVRIKALSALPDTISADELRVAASDPHWRVRHELIRIVEHRALHGSVVNWNGSERERGFVAYSGYRQNRDDVPVGGPNELPFDWDHDPAVLLAELRNRPRKVWLEQLPFLVHHDAERVRRWAVGQLLEFGTKDLVAQAAAFAKDPRHPGWWDVDSVVRRLPSSRRPHWKGIERVLPEWSPGHPMRRTCSDPEHETCWHVLNRYLQQQQMVPAQVLPAPGVRPPGKPVAHGIELSSRSCQKKRLAVSGHYLLPIEEFATAFDAGIDRFFWEPNYGTFNEFVKRLGSDNRQRLDMIAGTFEAEPRLILKEVDRALRLLKIERLHVFLLFWSRSAKRFSDEALRLLETLVAEGKIETYGLSTHQWQLAQQQIEAGWSPVMVRHNLAHRGAEEVVFPAARTQDTRIFSFNSTCYGRLIEAGISARDCIRYSLHQPEIDLILTAPSSASQLQENLSALDQPPLDEQQIGHWRQIGDHVYASNKAFQNGLRSR